MKKTTTALRAVMAALGGALVCAAMLTGCAGEALPTATSSMDTALPVATASPSAPAATSIGATSTAPPTDVAGTPVTFEGGRVTSACYEYEVDPDVAHELRPEAEGCVGDIRWAGGDLLTQTMIRVVTAQTTAESLAADAESAGAEIIDRATMEVAGAEAQVVTVVDTLGLMLAYVEVPLPAGRFAYEGDPLTAILAIAYVDEGGEMAARLEDILYSLEIAD